MTILKERLRIIIPAIVIIGILSACEQNEPSPENKPTAIEKQVEQKLPPERTRTPEVKVVHVYVALADNKNQGIVPVSAMLGNGQDPFNNLYWGAMYGVKTYFKKQKQWETIQVSPKIQKPEILECTAFIRGNLHVVAQAYDGAKMKSALEDFFEAAAGSSDTEFNVLKDGTGYTIKGGGSADMICFVGHNGLMDVQSISIPTSAHKLKPDYTVVLACKSNPYFCPLLEKYKSQSLITTSGLMAPEAYTLEAIIRTWDGGKDENEIHLAAAQAYARYQKCSISAAKRLFVVGR